MDNARTQDTIHNIHIAHGKNRYQTQRTQSVVLGGTTPQLNMV